MMRLYYLSGERTAALRQYERCVAALSEELDVSPDDRTEALYEQIKNNEPLISQSAPAMIVSQPAPRTIELNDAPAQQHVLHVLSERLRQLQMLQSSMQRDIQHTLHLIEQTLTGGGPHLHAAPALTYAEARPDQPAAELIRRSVHPIIGQEYQPHTAQAAG